jgi:hypothetical protein
VGDDLDALALKYGTDKGTKPSGRLTPKGYTKVYEPLLAPIRDTPITLLEIGVQFGASLKMWEDYFPKARIFGIDIKEKCREYATERTAVLIGDQTDRAFLRDVVEETGPLDVVIDDGGHRMEQHRVSLEELFPHVKQGGFYSIEDLQTAYRSDYGGGYLAESSTIEMLKGVIDGLNGSPEADRVVKGVSRLMFSQRMAILFRD